MKIDIKSNTRYINEKIKKNFEKNKDNIFKVKKKY